MDTQLDEIAVYNNYRASLKAQKAASRGQGRTAARKQEALKVTSDRYGLRIGEVKQLVRKHDALNGITHNHSSGYILEQEYNRRYDEAHSALSAEDLSICSACSTQDEAQLVRLRAVGFLGNGRGYYNFGNVAEDIRRLLKVTDFDSATLVGFKALKPEEWRFAVLCFTCGLRTHLK